MNQHQAERVAVYAKLRQSQDASPIRKVIDLRTGRKRTRLEDARVAWKARQGEEV